MWKKVLEIKSSWKQSPTILRLYFLGLFLVPVWFYTKKSPEKSPLIVEKAWEQRMFITMEKGGLILKTPLAILNMQMHKRKVLFMKTSQTWPHFLKTWDFFLGFFFFGFIFFRTFTPVIIFPEIFWQPPYSFRKKSPRNLNSGLYFQWHFVLGLQKIGTFLPKFLFIVYDPTTTPV